MFCSFDDLTTGASLAWCAAPGDPGSSEDRGGWDWPPNEWSLTWERTYPMDATHLYGVTLFACAGGGDDRREAVWNLEVCPVVPAPGALLLAGTGAALVASRRRSAAR
ncbi:MAG: hypothetical protein M1376_08465 [Planctomycetes bacterium]|nr:hypothetical protein [Planctomycetota bacterium]